MRREMLKWLVCALIMLSAVSAAVAQSFTYQGFLKEGGNPANNRYDFQFRLYDQPIGGTQIGSTFTILNQLVQNGLFTVDLNFGAYATIWTGADRYLEISVRRAGEEGPYTTLSPRVKIRPTPYSFYAFRAPWSGIVGVPPASGDVSGSYPNLTVVGLQGRSVSSTAPANGQVLKWNGTAWAPGNDLTDLLWTQSGSNIFYTAGNVGIGTSSPSHRLHVETNTGDSAIAGNHTATTGIGVGVYGRSNSLYGLGVFGWATATSGIAIGVSGRSDSTSGRGVFGWATATSGVNYGVYGQSESPDGYGGYFIGRGYFSGNVGIGTTNPTTKLDVNGTVRATGFQMPTGAGAGRVLTSDASGNATWQDLPAGATVWAVSGNNIYNTNTGNVGIGTTLPIARLHVLGGNWNTETTNGDFVIGDSTYRLKIGIARAGSGAGHATIAAQGGVNLLSLGAGTTLDTQRTLTITGDGKVGIGTISPATTLEVNGTTRTKVLEITGADLAEKFPTTEKIEPGMVVEIDPDHPGHLRLSRSAYNKRVAGIVAGANGLSTGVILGNLEGSEKQLPIAMSGHVWVYADATERAIEPGDLLTTAERPGYAMAVDPNRPAHGAILGKAMTRLEKGKTGMVLVLVNLH